jgi:hypothetical protein
VRHIKEIILTANLGNGEKGVRASHIDQNWGRVTVARFILIFANGGAREKPSVCSGGRSCACSVCARQW